MDKNTFVHMSAMSTQPLLRKCIYNSDAARIFSEKNLITPKRAIGVIKSVLNSFCKKTCNIRFVMSGLNSILRIGITP